MAANALNMGPAGAVPNMGGDSSGAASSAPPIATQCFMLSNMFDPAT